MPKYPKCGHVFSISDPTEEDEWRATKEFVAMRGSSLKDSPFLQTPFGEYFRDQDEQN